MAKQLDSIQRFVIEMKPNSLELLSISCTGMASDGLGYGKPIFDSATVKELSQAEQDAALLLVKMAKNRIEAAENLVVKPDPTIIKP